MNITDENGKPVTYWGGLEAVTKTGVITAARITNSTPSAYRLMQKLDGSLVLQGAYVWEQGSEGGYEWRDVPTEMEQA